jgi:hypothetical protein
LGNGIPGVRLVGVYSCASVSGHGKVMCIVESAVSRIILVIFGCLLYDSRMQLCFVSQLHILYRLYVGTCYAVAERSKLYCVDELCTQAYEGLDCRYWSAVSTQVLVTYSVVAEGSNLYCFDVETCTE